MVEKALEDIFATLPHDSDDDSKEEKRRSKRRKTKKKDTAKRDWLHCFISLALPQSRHQLLGDGSDTITNSTLVLSVHHQNPSMRAAAVKQLGKSIMDDSQVWHVNVQGTIHIYLHSTKKYLSVSIHLNIVTQSSSQLWQVRAVERKRSKKKCGFG